MQLIHTAADLDVALAAARTNGQTIAFVPTMGALHDGHLSLAKIAREEADIVVVSIFVNPKQFGAGEDFDKYPRTLDADVATLGDYADIVFAPAVEDIYPADLVVEEQHAGPVGTAFEGAARPGHFDGMLTVVARLFDLVQPDVAIFGQKDAQQLFLVQQLVAAKYPDLEIIGAPIIREASGLAMSSRNRYLSPEDARLANVLNRTLRTAGAELEAGAAPSAVLQAHLEQLATDAPQAKLDYLQLVSAKDFEPVSDDFHGTAILLIAAKIGQTRLIDNLEVLI